ncbi:MAG: hypothetical protein AMXMBFR7_01310 [Planctomycetota bacterium]
MASSEIWKELLDREAALGTEATVRMTFKPRTAPTEIADETPLPATVISGEPATRIGSVAPTLRSNAPIASAGSAPVPPDYRVLAPLGEGGMGIVFRAMQPALGREIALKVAKQQEPHARASFVSEARVTGRLEHANIVPLHALGTLPDGAPCIALKLVQGTTWRKLIQARSGPGPQLKEHLRILQSVGNALAFAHQQGVLHRDLKPDNVMVAEFGQVFVMDWGLAARLPNASAELAYLPEASALRGPAGTPAYMAPELARGDGAASDARTDVYLLGACLHEALTGRPRHAGATITEILSAADRSEPFAYPPEVPTELAALCNRACAREPAARFADTLDFLKALETYLEHEQAERLAAKGARLLGDLEALLLQEAPPEEIEERARTVQRLYAQGHFAFQHAKELWPESNAARSGARKLTAAMLEHALRGEDLALARRLSEEEGAEAFRARIAELAERIAAREREMERLRETAARHDWKHVARPLGTVLIAGACCGAFGTLTSAALRTAGRAWSSPLILMSVWMLALLVTGGLALKLLRGRKVSFSAVSEQLAGTWLAVGVACLGVELLNWRMVHPPFKLLPVTALFLGVGVATLAFQTHRALLGVAAAFLGTSYLMTVWPEYGRELLGVTLCLALGALGLFLRRVKA